MTDREAPPLGLDPKNWISIPEAVSLIKELRPAAKVPAVRKLLLGGLIHGKDSRLEAIAINYRERYDRIDREPLSSYRAPIEAEAFVPSDFWRIGMAWDDYADHSFATGNFIFIGEVCQSELPFRLRDRTADLANERVNLFQEASGVHVARGVLEAIVRDRQWRQWGEILDAVTNKGRRGKAPMWKWDEVFAALAMEASSNPAILRQGSGPIKQFINDRMRELHNDQLPDPGDVSRRAQLFSKMWGPDQWDEAPI